MEKRSLPVDVRRSKTSLLKFPSIKVCKLRAWSYLDEVLVLRLGLERKKRQPFIDHQMYFLLLQYLLFNAAAKQ